VAVIPGIVAAVRTAQLYFKHGRCPMAALVAAAEAERSSKVNVLFRENLF